MGLFPHSNVSSIGISLELWRGVAIKHLGPYCKAGMYFTAATESPGIKVPNWPIPVIRQAQKANLNASHSKL